MTRTLVDRHAPWAAWRRAVALIAMALLGGCAALPTEVRRTPSEAITDVAGTTLARVAAASTPGAAPGQSGLRLLPNGEEALATRLALIRRAQVSLDVQYYVIADDPTGRQFLRELHAAASRGVRVRLLVDDLHAAGQEELLSAMAAQSNAEVRLFNPLPARSGPWAMRMLLSLHQFDRINRRMHNKLLIADNSFAVTGGRNIANEYFMRGEVANFVDMDVLAGGAVVRDLSDLFDRFWNSDPAYPIESLRSAAAEGDGTPERLQALLAVPADPALPVAPDTDTAAAADPPTPGRASIEAELDAGRTALSAASAELYADPPTKAAGGLQSLLAPTAMDNALQLLRAARSEVMIASPYFVPGQRGLALMREASEHQVRISVLTNSLAATDEPLAYWGYGRYRLDMLKMGISLSELSPTQHRKSELLRDFGSSKGRLHAKVAVVDRQRVLVGSMNMDSRSSRTNTELALVIHSPEIAAQAEQTLRDRWGAGNYRLRIADSGEQVEWLATDGERDAVHRAEPHVGWFERLRLGVLSLFVSEDLL